MKCATLVLLGLISLVAAQSVQNNVNLGASVSVNATTDTTINYIGGASLQIRLSKAAQVTLASYASVSVGLPSGFQALGFGLSSNVGFQLAVTPSDAVIISASLTTPDLSVAAAALLTGVVKAGCLQLDLASNTYTYIEITSLNAGKTITIPLPYVGAYVFVAVQLNAKLPATFGRPENVPGSENRTYSYSNGFALAIQTAQAGSLNVEYSAQSSYSGPSGHRAASGFFQIDLNSTSSNSFTGGLVWNYTQSDIDKLGVAENSLKWAFYNTVTNAWEFPSTGGSVDTEANVVTQSTTHFSEWAVYGSSTTQGSLGVKQGQAIGLVLFALIASVIVM